MQQWNTGLCQMLKMFTSGQNSCSHLKSPNGHWSSDWWCWYELSVCPSVNQTLPQLIKISHKMLTDPLLYHCQDSVINILLKSDMLRSHMSGAMMKSGVSRRSSLTVVRTRCAVLLKFKLVLCFRLWICLWQEIHWGIRENYQNRAWFDKVIAKTKWCSFLTHMVLQTTKWCNYYCFYVVAYYLRLCTWLRQMNSVRWQVMFVGNHCPSDPQTTCSDVWPFMIWPASQVMRTVEPTWVSSELGNELPASRVVQCTAVNHRHRTIDFIRQDTQQTI